MTLSLLLVLSAGDNVLLDESRLRAKLTDFGSAKSVQASVKLGSKLTKQQCFIAKLKAVANEDTLWTHCC